MAHTRCSPFEGIGPTMPGRSLRPILLESGKLVQVFIPSLSFLRLSHSKPRHSNTEKRVQTQQRQATGQRDRQTDRDILLWGRSVALHWGGVLCEVALRFGVLFCAVLRLGIALFRCVQCARRRRQQSNSDYGEGRICCGRAWACRLSSDRVGEGRGGTIEGTGRVVLPRASVKKD